MRALLSCRNGVFTQGARRGAAVAGSTAPDRTRRARFGCSSCTATERSPRTHNARSWARVPNAGYASRCRLRVNGSSGMRRATPSCVSQARTVEALVRPCHDDDPRWRFPGCSSGPQASVRRAVGPVPRRECGPVRVAHRRSPPRVSDGRILLSQRTSSRSRPDMSATSSSTRSTGVGRAVDAGSKVPA
jgi:hypothetical protein